MNEQVTLHSTVIYCLLRRMRNKRLVSSSIQLLTYFLGDVVGGIVLLSYASVQQ